MEATDLPAVVTVARDGSAPLDTTRALESLGWTPPQQQAEADPPEELTGDGGPEVSGG